MNCIQSKERSEEAHTFYCQAADAGSIEACYQAGRELATRKAYTSKSVRAAQRYLKKAATNGHADARDVLDKLNQRLADAPVTGTEEDTGIDDGTAVPSTSYERFVSNANLQYQTAMPEVLSSFRQTHSEEDTQRFAELMEAQRKSLLLDRSPEVRTRSVAGTYVTVQMDAVTVSLDHALRAQVKQCQHGSLLRLA